MVNTIPSIAALKQIGDILYEFKERPQFQTDITNLAIKRNITNPAELRALIEEHLPGGAYASSPEVFAHAAPAPANPIPEAVAALVTPDIARPQGLYSGSATLGQGVGDLAAPIFPSVAQASYAPAFSPAPEPVQPTAFQPTPIAHTTSGFMGSASLGVDQFRPQDLPDVRPRVTEQSNDFGAHRS